MADYSKWFDEIIRILAGFSGGESKYLLNAKTKPELLLGALSEENWIPPKNLPVVQIDGKDVTVPYVHNPDFRPITSDDFERAKYYGANPPLTSVTVGNYNNAPVFTNDPSAWMEYQSRRLEMPQYNLPKNPFSFIGQSINRHINEKAMGAVNMFENMFGESKSTQRARNAIRNTAREERQAFPKAKSSKSVFYQYSPYQFNLERAEQAKRAKKFFLNDEPPVDFNPKTEYDPRLDYDVPTNIDEEIKYRTALANSLNPHNKYKNIVRPAIKAGLAFGAASAASAMNPFNKNLKKSAKSKSSSKHISQNTKTKIMNKMSNSKYSNKYFK